MEIASEHSKLEDRRRLSVAVVSAHRESQRLRDQARRTTKAMAILRRELESRGIGLRIEDER